MEDEILREIHETRERIAKEHGYDRKKLDAFYESLRFPGFTYGTPGRIFHTEEELDEYIEERNREFESRQAGKVDFDGMRPSYELTARTTMPGINTDGITRSVNTLELALECLREQEPGEVMYDVYRSACMNEFQVIVELADSLLRRRLRPYFATVSQVNELTVGRVFRESARRSLISVEECRRWLGYRDHRNASAHRYGKELAECALMALPSLVEDGRRIAAVIGAETDE